MIAAAESWIEEEVEHSEEQNYSSTEIYGRISHEGRVAELNIAHLKAAEISEEVSATLRCEVSKSIMPNTTPKCDVADSRNPKQSKEECQ